MSLRESVLILIKLKERSLKCLLEIYLLNLLEIILKYCLNVNNSQSYTLYYCKVLSQISVKHYSITVDLSCYVSDFKH